MLRIRADAPEMIPRLVLVGHAAKATATALSVQFASDRRPSLALLSIRFVVVVVRERRTRVRVRWQ